MLQSDTIQIDRVNEYARNYFAEYYSALLLPKFERLDERERQCCQLCVVITPSSKMVVISSGLDKKCRKLVKCDIFVGYLCRNTG